MLRRAGGILSFVVFSMSVAVAQAATGPCQQTELPKRVDCLNNEVASLLESLKQLKDQFVPWDQNVDIKAHLNNPSTPDRCLGPKNTGDAGPASFNNQFCGAQQGGSFTIHKP